MWEEVFNLAISNGIWAVLFVALLIYELKDSRKREVKYQQTIERLNTNLGIVKEINEEVKVVKDLLQETPKTRKKAV